MRQVMKRALAAIMVACWMMGAATPAIAHRPPDLSAIMKPELFPDAFEVSKAIAKAKPGELIVVRGHIPAKDGFDPAMAIFTVEEAPPADAPATKQAPPSMQVRLLDAGGEPLKGSVEQQQRLKAGAEVFVLGTVRSCDGRSTLVVDAAALHVPRGGLPAGLFVKEADPAAQDVSKARKESMKVGQSVTLRGRVGGGPNPFVDGRAMFTIVGRGLKPCNENPDDRCVTPWDYCCDSKAEIVANSVTVQVADTKGQPLRTGMKGRRGLRELSEVVVKGKVTAVSGQGVVVTAETVAVTP